MEGPVLADGRLNVGDLLLSVSLFDGDEKLTVTCQRFSTIL